MGKPTNFSIEESLQVVWEALWVFQEDLNLDDPNLPKELREEREEQWDDICTAMAWITEATQS